VHASTTPTVVSSTVPVAISPARPDQTFTVHVPSLYVASVVGCGGYCSSQCATFGYCRKTEMTFCFVARALPPPCRDPCGSGLLNVVVVGVVACAAGTSASANNATSVTLRPESSRACCRGS